MIVLLKSIEVLIITCRKENAMWASKTKRRVSWGLWDEALFCLDFLPAFSSREKLNGIRYDCLAH
jgi:hypothetical protein